MSTPDVTRFGSQAFTCGCGTGTTTECNEQGNNMAEESSAQQTDLLAPAPDMPLLFPAPVNNDSSISGYLSEYPPPDQNSAQYASIVRSDVHPSDFPLAVNPSDSNFSSVQFYETTSQNGPQIIAVQYRSNRGFSRHPQPAYCQRCEQIVTTQTRRKQNCLKTAGLLVLALFAMTSLMLVLFCWPRICCVLHARRHYCPLCGVMLGETTPPSDLY